MPTSTASGRRPLRIREVPLVHTTARWLSQQNIHPNTISVASVGFAAFAAVCFLLVPTADGGARILTLLGAALGIQLRLLCNLFDGMVAVEGVKRTKSGELFNDIPDRIADPLILVAAGYAIPLFSYGPALGWAAGLLAVMTAYVRVLGSSQGVPADFQGPMAKQHRMATMTVACLLSLVEPWLGWDGMVIAGSLWLIVLGCMITLMRRVRHAYRILENS